MFLTDGSSPSKQKRLATSQQTYICRCRQRSHINTLCSSLQCGCVRFDKQCNEHCKCCGSICENRGKNSLIYLNERSEIVVTATNIRCVFNRCKFTSGHCQYAVIRRCFSKFSKPIYNFKRSTSHLPASDVVSNRI